MFDLAYGYPLSEVSFAKAMASQDTVTREEVFVVTKLHPRFLGYKETLRAIDMSLENLNVTYIDLYLIHSTECDDFLLACEEGFLFSLHRTFFCTVLSASEHHLLFHLSFSFLFVLPMTLFIR